MIKREDKNKNFKLTKLYTEKYYNHSYYINNLCPKDLLKGELSKENWETEKIRIKLFKWYFKFYQNETEENCKKFFKEKLKDIFQNIDAINKEITKWKNSIKYTGSPFVNILNKLDNLKDNVII